MKLIKVAIVSVLIFLIGCDVGGPYKYIIMNKSNDSLFLEYRFNDDTSNYAYLLLPDSVRGIEIGNYFGLEDLNENFLKEFFDTIVVRNKNFKIYNSIYDRNAWEYDTIVTGKFGLRKTGIVIYKIKITKK